MTRKQTFTQICDNKECGRVVHVSANMEEDESLHWYCAMRWSEKMMGHLTWDFCCFECLLAWANAQGVDGGDA